VQGIGVMHALMTELEKLKCEQLRGEILLLPVANPQGLDIKVGEHTPGPFSLATGRNYNRENECLVCRNEHMRNYSYQVNVENFVEIFGHLPWDLLRQHFNRKLIRALTKRRRMQPRGPDPFDRQSRFVLKRALNADRVLDLHTSTRGIDFLYTPPWASSESAYLDIPYALIMDESSSGALDEAINLPWFMLREALLQRGKTIGEMPAAMTLELGGQESYDLIAAQRQAKALIHYFAFLGLLDRPVTAPELQPVREPLNHFLGIYAPRGGIACFHAKPGMRVHAGQVLAEILCWDHGHPPSHHVSCKAPFDGVVLAHYPSAIVHEGTCIYRLLKTTQAEHRS
jgi:predicted deacylase